MDTILKVIVIVFALGIGAMVLFFASFYFMSPIGKPVNKNKSRNYNWGKFSKNRIFYSVGGGSLSGGTELTNVDIPSFEVIDTHYAKDKNTVYFEYDPIDVDLDTFYVGDDYLPRDAKHVYLIENNYGDQPSVALPVEDADPKTYQRSDIRSDWGKDSKRVYYKTKAVDVDYDSFEILSHSWARDKNQLLQLSDDGFKIILTGITDFEFLDNGYLRANHTIYYSGHLPGDSDPEGLVLRSIPIQPSSKYEFLSDAHILYNDIIHYYCEPTEIDPSSFKPFNHPNENRLIFGFSKDKNHVYMYNQILDHIDAPSFIYQDDIFKDKYNHYNIRGEVQTPISEREDEF